MLLTSRTLYYLELIVLTYSFLSTHFSLFQSFPEPFLNWPVFFPPSAVWLLGDECEHGGNVGGEVPWTEGAVGTGSVPTGSVPWQLTL